MAKLREAQGPREPAPVGGAGRVLFSMKVYLGDAVMAVPTLNALDAAGWDTTLLTAPLAAKALGRSPVIPYQKNRWPLAILRQARLLREARFDACVLVNRSVRAALLARLAGIPVRIGHPVEGRARLLTHLVPYDPERFEAASTADLVAPLGVVVADPIPRLFLTEAEREEGDRLRQGADLAIQPGARYDKKRLPFEALRDAARAWQAEGRRIVTVGGPEERMETDTLIAALDRPVVDLVGRCGVRETMAVLAGASAAVGADTGVMHLAVAVGCPTVQAFGPTPVAKWGHAYGPHRVLAAPDGCMAALTAGELPLGGRREVSAGRRLLVFLLFLLSLPLRAQNALVLIQHDQAGPLLPSADYIHAQWILWPEDQAGWNNRILSLATGADLQGDPPDARFRAVGGGWATENGPSLERRGAFEARRAYLGPVETTVVQKARGGVSRSVFLLALANPSQLVFPRPFDSSLPKDGLVVYEAANWNDAMAIQRRVAGRTLIVEYPPAAEDRWSRYWLYGGWPAGVPTERDLGVPGLVRARRALGMLMRPSEFDWRPNNAGRWGGPNRWLEHGRETGPGVLLAWYLGGVFVLAWALAQVMNEDRGPLVSELLVLLALSPATLVLAGAGARLGGLESWPIVLVLAALGLYAFSLLGGLVVRRVRPEAHPLWVPCLVGFATMLLCDPLWSDFSGRLGPVDLDVPGDALGAFLAYLAGVASFAQGRWTGRALVAAVLLIGATAHPWWIGGHAGLLVLPAVALVAAEGLFRPLLLVLLALLPTGLLGIAQRGVAWNPDGLLGHADEAASLNLWQSARLLGAPAWGGLLLALAVGLLVGNRFLAYRLRKLFRLDPRLRAFPWVAGAALAVGVTEPLALPAAPVVAFAALLALAYDGLRANA